MQDLRYQANLFQLVLISCFVFMRIIKLALFGLALLCLYGRTEAQSVTKDSLKSSDKLVAQPSLSKWYDKISIRGYAQFRYNRLLETNPALKCEQCDKSIGEGQTFAFRRARMIFSGDVHPQFFIYIQFDYSADATSVNKHFMQLRDAYFDYAIDKKKEYRFRFGQSKVPFGFENLKSSSNRLPMDRSDALNSGAPNERDFGVYFMYAPASVREKYKKWASASHKGSSDYGVFAIGLYNGQSTNKPELNNNLHAVARLSYPFGIKKQVIEPGIQAYSGKFTLPSDNLTAGVKKVMDRTYLDQRVGATINVYPQPFGILAEYNIGKSPGFNTATDSIQSTDLKGGFVTLSYKTVLAKGDFFPFIRLQQYDGPKKHELDARLHNVREVEFGFEWSVIKNLEITLSYVISHRKYEDFKTSYDEKGRFLRIQLQANY